MEWDSVFITRTHNENKEFRAIFTTKNGNRKTVPFGTRSNYGLNRELTRKKTITDRNNYYARHWKKENWNDPATPGALSRWILWGEHPDWVENITLFGQKFGIRTSIHESAAPRSPAPKVKRSTAPAPKMKKSAAPRSPVPKVNNNKKSSAT